MEKTGRALTQGWDLQRDEEWKGLRVIAREKGSDGSWSVGCLGKELMAAEGKPMGKACEGISGAILGKVEWTEKHGKIEGWSNVVSKWGT